LGRPAALARNQTRVTRFPPRPNQTFELANADAKTLGSLALTQMVVQCLAHHMRPITLRSTHQKIPFGHTSPNREHRQKGTF
jgi:hypothetical protein